MTAAAVSSSPSVASCSKATRFAVPDHNPTAITSYYSEGCRIQKQTTMKRSWTRRFLVVAVLIVVTQVSMLGIAMVHLETTTESSSLSSSSLSSLSPLGGKNRYLRNNLLESFRNNKPMLSKQQDHHGTVDASPENQEQTPLPLKEQPPPKVDPRRHEGRHSFDPAVSLPQPRPRELIHVVHTRFMQHQGNLTTLGVARLEQFLAFCLPTMVHQTTQDFFWMIKVDPLLERHEESKRQVLEPLLQAVRKHNHNNIYVVASNYNFNMEGHGGSWRDGQEGEELLRNGTYAKTGKLGKNTSLPTASKVYTGDLARLERAYLLRERLPVLETRLDADDGLRRDYLATVQATARNRFLGPDPQSMETPSASPPPPKPEWLYWCIMTQIEWHSERYSNADSGGSGSATNNSTTTPDLWELRNRDKVYYGDPQLGYVTALAYGNFCITPGLTVGYGVGTGMAPPRYQHTAVYPSLHDKFKKCHSEADRNATGKGPCLERVEEAGDDGTVHALRSRALTSAGMDGVGNSDGFPEHQNNETSQDYGASPPTAPDANNDADSGAAKVAKVQRTLWTVLKRDFGLDPGRVRRAQAYLTDHRAAIAYQNSLGQCSHGHSCKDKARARLHKMMVQGTGPNGTLPEERTAA